MNKSVSNQPVSTPEQNHLLQTKKKSLSSPFYSTPVWSTGLSDIKTPFSKGLTLVIFRILGTPGSDAEQSPARKYLSVAPVWLVCRSTHKYM